MDGGLFLEQKIAKTASVLRDAGHTLTDNRQGWLVQAINGGAVPVAVAATVMVRPTVVV